MDFLCFFLTSRILSKRMSVGRTVLASAVGGIYSDLALFIRVGKVMALFIDIVVCFGICLIAELRRGKAREIPLFTLVYVAVSMALGGFMTAIFNLLNRVYIPIEETQSSDGISVWLFALLAGVSALLTLAGGSFFKRRSCREIREIEVVYGGKKGRLRSMTDSGNLLREPISGRACIVADVDALGGIISEELRSAARNGGLGIERLSREEQRRIRLIPIRTASGEGSLLGIRPERVIIIDEKGEREVDAVIVLTEIGESGEGCEALLPSELAI